MHEHLEQIEKSKIAISIIDKILPHLPDQGVFHFAYFAKDVLNWPSEEVRELVSVKPQLVHIALNQLQYINEKTKGFYYELNETGRKAKKAGGHFAYQKTIDEKFIADKERQKLNDEKLKYDVKNSKRIFKTYWWTFTFAVIGLAISLTLGILKLLEVFQHNPVK